jgi:hypothetical protein
MGSGRTDEYATSSNVRFEWQAKERSTKQKEKILIFTALELR